MKYDDDDELLLKLLEFTHIELIIAAMPVFSSSITINYDTLNNSLIVLFYF